MKNLKYTFVAIISSFLLVFSFGTVATAQTTDTSETDVAALLEQIQSLLALVSSLQEQLNQVEQTVNEIADFVYSRSLKVGDKGEDVKQLQKLLNADERTKIASSGVGSPGKETDFFGNLTKEAVIKFQELHKEDILTPVGLSKGSGYVGPSTIAKLNKLADKKVDYDYDDKKETDATEKDDDKYEDKDDDKDDKEDDKKDTDDSKDDDKDDKDDTVSDKAPDIDFYALDYNVPSGDNTKLLWKTIGFTEGCTASNAWSGDKVAGEGYEYTEQITEKKIFVLECYNKYGTTSKSITIDVTDATSKPTVEFSSNYTNIAYSGDIKLSWEAFGADSCEASGDWSGAKKIGSNYEEYDDLVADKTYTLTCTNDIGSTAKTISIDVGTPAAPVITLSATDEISRNEKSTVTWSVANNADSCSASGGWSGGQDPKSGSYTTGNLQSDTSFTLFCTNLGGTHSKTVTTVVKEDPPIIEMSVTPSSVAPDSTAVVQWSVQNADSCVASNSWTGSKSNTGGSESTGAVQSSQTYTLTCTNSGGDTLKNVTLTVS